MCKVIDKPAPDQPEKASNGKRRRENEDKDDNEDHSYDDASSEQSSDGEETQVGLNSLANFQHRRASIQKTSLTESAGLALRPGRS